MPTSHTVCEGECISSIADKYGFYTETIWNDSANARLKAQREDPNLLSPGDVVIIPDKREKSVTKPVDASYQFVRKGVPALFRLQVMYAGKPRAEQDYELIIDNEIRLVGKTDTDGVLDEFISPSARRGRLTIGPDHYRLSLELGHLEPHNHVRGIQQRLNNLGFSCGPEDGARREELTQAIRNFQARYELEVTGQLDETTVNKLKEIHDDVHQSDEQTVDSSDFDEGMSVD